MNLSKPSWTSRRIYPWIVIAFCSLFLVYRYIIQISPTVMTDQLMRVFGIHGAGLGYLSATMFSTYLVVQLFVGPLLDIYSTRLLTAIAIAICALGALVFATAHSFLVAAIGRSLSGIGVAFATVSYMKLAAIWFKPRQFAFISGLLATAAMTGSIAAQAPLAYMIHKLHWRPSLVYIAMAGLLLAISFYLVVRDQNPNSTIQLEKQNQKFSLNTILTILRNKHNWYLMLYSGLTFAPVAVFGGLWGNPYIQQAYQLNTTQSGYIVSMVFLGLAVGGPALGFLSDKIRNRSKVMYAGVLISLLPLIIAIYVPHLPIWFLASCLFLFGFGTGSFMLGFTAGKELNEIHLAATVIGLINSGDALFGFISVPLVGKVLDIFWSGKYVNGVPYFSVSEFHIAFIILPIYLIFSFIFLRLLCKDLQF